MSVSPANDPALHLALRDLMKSQAPGATLLASIGERVLSVSADFTTTETEAELVPPDDWLAHGDLAWITRDGALLGLLWSEDAPVPPGAVHVLTLLLSAASAEGANREVDMLITQLPAPTAWLSADLVFKQVSRTFLELYGLNETQVLGKVLDEVFPGNFALAEQLGAAAGGRFVHLKDEPLAPSSQKPSSQKPDIQKPGIQKPGMTEQADKTDKEAKGTTKAAAKSAGKNAKEVTKEATKEISSEQAAQQAPQPTQQVQTRWVRGEAKPYFGGASAGILWSSQDITPEYQRAGEVSALLDTDAPIALLTTDGQVKQASRGLNTLLGAAEGGGIGTALWSWPCFSEDSAAGLQEMIQAAGNGTEARTEATLVSGSPLALSARRSLFAPNTLIIEGPQRSGSELGRGMVSQVLSLSDSATILLDHNGRTQLMSDQAATLLELDAASLVGLSLPRIAGQLGIKLYTSEGQPLDMPDFKALTLPLTRELLIGLPGGSTRNFEVRITQVDANSTSPSSASSASKRAGMLITLRDLTILRRAQAKMRHDAIHDPLTGLLNRAGLRTLLSQTGEESTGMVACLDLDGFGALNAAMGRTAGDLLLIQVAARLNDLASEHGGRSARLADDAFALYLPKMSAEVGAQKLQSALQEPLRAGRRLVPVTFAIGTADLPKTTPEQALADADMALQHAKREGRATVKQFSSSLRDQEAQTFEIEADLKEALESGQFSLLYQPAVSLKDGRAVTAEALIRWTHPRLGNIAPTRFLPLASRSDLITTIGEWVLREAGKGRDLVRERTGQTDWRTSVNLSLEELRRPGAADRLLPLMSRQNILDIEVSAGSLIDHSSETLEVLENLRGKGSRLIVDDFGDNASNLTALTRFPLSGLKLHPTLTARLPDDEMSLKLVKGTVSLAHSLGLAVTAVGVETYAQLDVLRDLGCDAAQGYALTPPLSADDLALWLKSRSLTGR